MVSEFKIHHIETQNGSALTEALNMESKKKVLNVSLVQTFIDAAVKIENLSNEMLELETSYNKAVDAASEAEKAVIADSELLLVLQVTGIRTLNDKLVTVDAEGSVVINSYVQAPSMWEFKNNEE